MRSRCRHPFIAAKRVRGLNNAIIMQFFLCGGRDEYGFSAALAPEEGMVRKTTYYGWETAGSLSNDGAATGSITKAAPLVDNCPGRSARSDFSGSCGTLSVALNRPYGAAPLTTLYSRRIRSTMMISTQVSRSKTAE
jgi:hypothetical protein